MPVKLQIAIIEALIFSTLGVTISYTVAESATTSVEPEIRIPGERMKYSFERPALVAGVWHYVNISLEQNYTNVSLIAYKGESKPAEGYSYRNYYLWWYNASYVSLEQWDCWKDYYIEKEKCGVDKNYSFWVGVDGRAKTGNWSLEIWGDGAQIIKEKIFVEAPRPGFGVSSHIFFRGEPFKAGNLTSSGYLRTNSYGHNVPLKLRVTYNKYIERIGTSNLPEGFIVLHVRSETKHDVFFRASAWSPRIIEIEGKVIGTPIYTIPISANVSFLSSYEQTFPVTIWIGHGGWDLKNLSRGITFQYSGTKFISWNEPFSLTAYLCGKANVTFTVTCENITLVNITYNNAEQKMPFKIQSTEGKEEVAIINLKAEVPSTTAYVRYNLKVEDNTYTYSTRIDVGAKPKVPITPKEGIPRTGLWVVVGIIMIIAIYMAVRYLKARK